ncbi:hypothetical protein BHE74_00008586 [Ensete ventricosum]|nr:hypothetical protein BHE74_00008586 [Ensete ventricosum]
MITLVSSDDQEFELEVEACMKSDMIKFILDDCNTDNAIPLPNVKGKTLAKIIEYMKKHAGEEPVADEEELRAWDGEFMKVDTVTLYFLLNFIEETKKVAGITFLHGIDRTFVAWDRKAWLCMMRPLDRAWHNTSNETLSLDHATHDPSGQKRAPSHEEGKVASFESQCQGSEQHFLPSALARVAWWWAFLQHPSRLSFKCQNVVYPYIVGGSSARLGPKPNTSGWPCSPFSSSMSKVDRVRPTMCRGGQ